MREVIAALDEALGRDESVALIGADHSTDQQALRRIIDTPAAYVALIGRRRSERQS
jgi:xanthine/CO dehydrogenase XdhC/CoxF family maturation factor